VDPADFRDDRALMGGLRASPVREADELAVRAVDTARKYKKRGSEASALCLLAEVAAAGQPPDSSAAAGVYAQAMVLAHELGMRPLVAQCHARLAALNQRMGQRDQARDHLISAVTMFREMDMPFWLEKTELEMKTSKSS